jgi:phosphopantothenoylcysteine decarboxylase/phosphopantothenate--cysteine ligase
MKILLGVTGGIAAYKAAELVRALQQRGIDVQVAMTASAEEFIRPLTFAALTGHPVLGSLWQPDPASSEQNFDIEHIAIAQQIDALVIAPATANTLAKLAHGLADDLISTVYLATRAPVLIAPAMNVNMWDHPATQANLRTLEARGALIIPPGAGYLACGMTGAARLPDIETIAEAVFAKLTTPVVPHSSRLHRDEWAGHDLHSETIPTSVLSSFRKPLGLSFRGEAEESAFRSLTGETILITAGGTREPIDQVRFLGNRSSGKMGHALAEEAVARRAKVILITASPLPAPPACQTIRVTTTAEMLAAVRSHLPSATMVIKAAAVADFRPASVVEGKLRRGGRLTLELEPTEDILAEIVARRAPGTFVIGFAAETEDIVANGRAKLIRKSVDALVVNDVSNPQTGFDSDENAGWFLTADSTIELPHSSKRDLARRILDLAAGIAMADTTHSRLFDLQQKVSS